MESIRNIFKVGYGPSSSHTMGPAFAAIDFLNKNKVAKNFKVELYGSLASTGKGHLTDKTIKDILGYDRCEVIFRNDITYNYHPNGMKLFAYDDCGNEIDSHLVFSVGGGLLKELDEARDVSKHECYPHKKMTEIINYIKYNNMTLVDYIKTFDNGIMEYLEGIFDAMEECIKNGLNCDVNLPGPLNIKRKAKLFYNKYLINHDFDTLLYSLTLAVCEENASGNKVVTAPTCGSSGIIPGVLFSEYYYNHVDKKKLIEGLAIAGLICNIVKTNASISGAEVGCQGEVGTACSAASGMLAYIKGGNEYYIEYASEIALEHHLGMTCDPVDGMVQIPCIERNAMSARFSYNSCNYALLTDGNHFVNLDNVIRVMHETGMDIQEKYKETSTG